MPPADSRDTVPFNDLGRGVRAIRSELDAAVARVLDSGWYVLGPEHDAFESELAASLGAAHAVGLANGTDALELGLLALGVGRGDLVATVANAGGYTSTAVRKIGATPVYVDVDEHTLQMSPQSLRELLAASATVPKVVVITHLFGNVGELVELAAIAREAGARVLEDCAQSLGAVVDGKAAGTFGDLATTSFYPTKNLGALGDGGGIVTDDADLAARVRRLRQYGWESKYAASTPGGRNSRLDELQAAILRVRLPLLAAGNDRRRDIHRAYEAADRSGLLVNAAGPSYVAHLAVLRTPDRDAVREAFRAAGVLTDVHYPIPDHRQVVAGGAELVVPLPVTERAAAEILSIPMFPELRDDEVARISDVLGAL